MASQKVTHSLPLTLDHELLELSDQIHNLLFLSEGDCTPAQLEDYSGQFTHLLRYGRALGYYAAFLWQEGRIAIEWQAIGEAI